MRWLRLWTLACGISLLGIATPRAFSQPPERGRGEKYALLVGVKKYDPNEFRALAYSESDVGGLSKVLLANGYRAENVVVMTQTAGAEDLRFLPTSDRIRKEMAVLMADRREDDCVMIAFAGHGVQFRGESDSYFCPVDARVDDRKSLIALGEVYRSLEKCPAGFKLLLVDACRNDPLSRNARSREVVDLESVTRPQQQKPPGGVAALFSCSAGRSRTSTPTSATASSSTS